MSAWGEAKAADGRVYYWNKETKETSWTKPAGFDANATAATPATPATPAVSSAADWSTATAPDGRTYYFNKVTRETTWSKPAILNSQPPRGPAASGRPDFVAGGGQDFGRQGFEDRVARRDDRGHGLPQKPSFDGPRGGGNPWEARQERDSGMGGFRGPMPVKTDEPDYGTAEAAEEAFFKLLKRYNVSPDMDWQDALKLVIRDREYRAIKDPKERRQAFEKYCVEVRAQEKLKEKERKEKLREDFREMLSTHDDIKHYTRWKTARPLIAHEFVFKSAGDDDERRRMFDEYILELKKKHVEHEAQRRKSAIAELDALLKALIMDTDTKWVDAEEKIMSNDRFVSDDRFRSLHKFNVLTAFDNHMRALERVENENMQLEKRLRLRRERQARDGFRQLLHEKSREGKIKAGSKWQDFRPLVANDERYIELLGWPGSNPLDLFWDAVEEEEYKLRLKRNDAMDVLDELRWEILPDTKYQTFAEVMAGHSKTSDFTSDETRMIFDRLLEKVKRRQQEKQLGAKRQKRDIVDALRSAMRSLEPPVRLEDSFEDVAQKFAGNRDFEAADDEMRRSAYEKYMRRLKEKDEHERDRARRDRDRDRDYRNGSRRGADRSRDRSRRHRTRTPEIDAYEADRRKAQEVRERSYRKASFGITPPPRDRRDDRYDRDRRDDRREGMSIYDRERREREMERERNYISRADPRDKGRTLDYGDDDAIGSRPGSVRKRRDSDVSQASRRETKRTRHDRRTRTPEPMEGVLKEEEPALQSGSEEGEIEEV